MEKVNCDIKKRVGRIRISGIILRDRPEDIEPIFREGAIPVRIVDNSYEDFVTMFLLWHRFDERKDGAFIPEYEVTFDGRGFIKAVEKVMRP